MIPNIPKEYVEPLLAQTAALEQLQQEIIQTDTQQLTVQDIEVWRQTFGAIASVIKHVRRECLSVQAIFDHDALGQFHTLMGSLDIIYLDIQDNEPEQVTKWYERIRSALQGMLCVLHAMEFWMEDVVLDVQPGSLKDLVNHIVPSLEYCFVSEDGDYNGLTIDYPQDATVFMHSASLELLLINMAKNSRRHGCANTFILSAREEGDVVILEVSDDGSGIRDEIVNELFEWGKSGCEKGTGMGLAHARERMAAMGGSIECEPHGGLLNGSGGKGARFILKLQSS